MQNFAEFAGLGEFNVTGLHTDENFPSYLPGDFHRIRKTVKF